MAPYFGRRFIRDAKDEGRPVFAWTVNDEDMMRWCINNGLDGVITDDPKKFLEVCEEWERGKRDVQISWRQWMIILWINVMVIVFGAIFWWKYGGAKKQKTKTAHKEREATAVANQPAVKI